MSDIYDKLTNTNVVFVNFDTFNLDIIDKYDGEYKKNLIFKGGLG